MSSLRHLFCCLLPGGILFVGGCETFLTPDGGAAGQRDGREASFDSDGETGSGVSPREVQQIVDYHNQKRKEAGTNPVRWSSELARHAQGRAETIARTGKMAHLPQSQNRYGENLAQGGRGGNDSGFTVLDACESWYAEKAKMPKGAKILSAALFQSGVGHYTQMIWNESTMIGAGIAHFHKDGMAMTVVVCCYDPRGNFIGGSIY